MPTIPTSATVLAASLLLAGCASAKVDGLTMAAASPVAAPATLHVAVTLAPGLAPSPVAGRARELLEIRLVERYRDAGLAAAVAPSAERATVRVAIDAAEKGNQAKRMLIGFGAGRASLTTHTTFATIAAAPAMSFALTSTGSGKPGLIMPGAIAGATGNAVSLAVGGTLSVAGELGQGLTNEVDRSARQIVAQTARLYRSANWPWPAERS